MGRLCEGESASGEGIDVRHGVEILSAVTDMNLEISLAIENAFLCEVSHLGMAAQG